MPGGGHPSLIERRPGITELQWREARPICEQWYLHENKTINEVCQLFQQRFGHKVTGRRLKLRFREKWGWGKKLLLEHYTAMYCIFEDHDPDAIFWIAMDHGGRQKTFPEVKKEMTRKIATWKRKGICPEQHATLKDAARCLQLATVQWKNSRIREWHLIDPSEVPAIQPRPLVRIPLAQREPDVDMDTSDSSESDEELPEPADTKSGSEELNTRNFASTVPLHRLESNVTDFSSLPRQWDQLPHPNAFVASLTTSVLPQSASRGLMEPDIVVQPADDVGLRRLSDPLATDEAFNLSDRLAGMMISLDPTDARRMRWEKFFGQRLERHYPVSDPDHSRQLTVEIAGYYVQQCISGFDTLDPLDHPDRQEARQKLSQALLEDNQYLLPTIFWILVVMGAHDKDIQLAALIEDVRDCVESSHSVTARILRPVVQTLVIKHRMNWDELNAPDPGDATCRRQVDDVRRNFDPETEYPEIIQYLAARGNSESESMLIVQMYYAYYLKSTSRVDTALSMLVHYHQVAERVMGKRHLVTANYRQMIGRSYEAQGNGLAKSYYTQALFDLQDCEIFLHPFRNRILKSLAVWSKNQGHDEIAMRMFEEVFECYRTALGARSGATWGIARTIFEILEGRDCGQRAHERMRALRAQHDEEFHLAKAYERQANAPDRQPDAQNAFIASRL